MTPPPKAHTLVSSMGAVYVNTALRRLDAAEPAYHASFLIDTGATDSMAPASELRRLGIEPAGRQTYRLADESLQEYVFGLARIEVMGRVTAGRILFGPDDAQSLLGVTALQSIGIVVDATHETASLLPATLLKELAAV